LQSPFDALRNAMRAACLAAAAAASGHPYAQRLVVVTSADTAPYEQAVAGARSLGVPVVTLSAADPTNAASLIDDGPDTSLVTLGAAAAALAARLAPSTPAVNCMIVRNEENRSPAGHVVPFDVPIEAQIESLRRLLPRVRNVGILFDPARGDRRVQETADALRSAGFVPMLEAVAEPTALPNALSRLATRIDVLLALPDSAVYSRENSRALLLFSFRRGVPLVGPTEAWVKAGALYAVDWNYADLGRYCAGLALQRPGKSPPPAPPGTRVIANARSAQQLGVAWDAATARTFDKVYP
jgi:putative ABC transport system substrate-binding protein